MRLPGHEVHASPERARRAFIGDADREIHRDAECDAQHIEQRGQKVQQSADKHGVPPQEFVDGVTAKFVALWEKLDVKYDAWAATTDPLHKECVRANLQMLWDDKDPAKGESRWIYKKTQRG